MVARARRDDGRLLVAFVREDEPDEAIIVANGARARDVAIMMIRQTPLRHGDRLTVQRYVDAD
jgi:hypothetical protein